MTKKEYDDIPGTFVFDADRSREGYHLNQFCISLRLQKNRDDFNQDENKYLDKYPMKRSTQSRNRSQLEFTVRIRWQYLLYLKISSKRWYKFSKSCRQNDWNGC